MSEVKGTLLTVILALSVFGIVYALINSAVQNKADQIANQITQAGGYASTDTNTLTYHF